MIPAGEKTEFFLRVSCYLGFFVCFAVWALYQVQYSHNPDAAVLGEFARRMVAGGTLGLDYIDTNPPFSIVLYTPAAAFSALTGLPLYHALTGYFFFLLILSVFLSWKILERFSFLRRDEKTVFVLSFAAAALAMASIFFGERDHIILLGLVPLLLAQFALNENIPLPRCIAYPAMLFGALAILIKPHYGLMPTLMIAWRVLERRDVGALELLQKSKTCFPRESGGLQVLENKGSRLRGKCSFWLFRTFATGLLVKPDFIIMAAAVLFYIALNAAFFSVYWTEALPDILDSYVAKIAALTMFSTRFKVLVFLNVLCLTLFYDCKNNTKKKFFLMLSVAESCLLIAYFTQYKGYFYHLVPALILSFTIMAAFAASLIREDRRAICALFPALAFLIVFFPVRPHYPTHAEYKALPLGEALNDCPQPCSFFVSNDYNYMTYETGLYKNAFHASRFPTLWFEPDISCAGLGPGDARYDKYAAMVGEDFARHRPSVVALLKTSDICPDGREIPFDFAGFFAGDKVFAREWKNYEFAYTLTFDRALYFPDTDSHIMAFDMYRRKEAPR